MSQRGHIKCSFSCSHQNPSLIGKNKGKSSDSVNRFMTKDNKLKGNEF